MKVDMYNRFMCPMCFKVVGRCDHSFSDILECIAEEYIDSKLLDAKNVSRIPNMRIHYV